EDALHAIVIEWEPLPALADPHAALAPGAAPIHPELGDNLLFSARVDSGGVDEAFACAHRVVAARLHTERHTAVPLETRGVVAEYNRGSGQLTVHQSTQTPFMMQALYARVLGLPEHHIRVICGDV